MVLKDGIVIDHRYCLIRKVGSGGFSEVWLAENQLNQLSVALKIYYSDSATAEERQRFIFRFKMVYSLRHTNLLSYSECNEDNGMLYFVMPYCERGSVAAQLGSMDETDAWLFLADVSAGLAYLHRQSIVHQDIKPDNVLISDDGAYLITDFDISVKTRNTRRMGDDAPAGTAAYMAPERFGPQAAPIQASDIWALGASLYELLSGNHPFGDNGGLYQKTGVAIPVFNRPVNRHLQSVINLCLQQEPWNRPTAKEISDWCNEFRQNRKISFNAKFCAILGISTGGKMSAYLKRIRCTAKKTAVAAGVIIAIAATGTGAYWGVTKISDYREEQERENAEEVQRVAEEKAAAEAAQIEAARQEKIKSFIADANSAFMREAPDYNAAFQYYMQAKQLGSTDPTGYANFLNKAQELLSILGECDDNVRNFLLKAQQLNDTEEVEIELSKCDGR